MNASHVRRTAIVAIWTALLVVFLYFLDRQYHAGSRLLAIGPVLLSIGMMCEALSGFVTRVSLRRGLRLTTWALLAGSLSAAIFL